VIEIGERDVRDEGVCGGVVVTDRFGCGLQLDVEIFETWRIEETDEGGDLLLVLRRAV